MGQGISERPQQTPGAAGKGKFALGPESRRQTDPLLPGALSCPQGGIKIRPRREGLRPPAGSRPA